MEKKNSFETLHGSFMDITCLRRRQKEIYYWKEMSKN